MWPRVLGEVLPSVLTGFRPDIVLYDAGVDTHMHDSLGKLNLTDKGLRRRELQVGDTFNSGKLAESLSTLRHLAPGALAWCQDLIRAVLFRCWTLAWQPISQLLVMWVAATALISLCWRGGTASFIELLRRCGTAMALVSLLMTHSRSTAIQCYRVPLPAAVRRVCRDVS